ncbi:MAG: gamma-glutamyl-gamma-aminobutyrate hydrolase family protein [Clostridia bacterium]|nr:gamma-glutamyl-gamma-aminobutyrate hydrolase family protein [Clostridia bacterium]
MCAGKKPVIGVVPLVDMQRESYWMLPGYMKGIEMAGGLPMMLPLTSSKEDIRQILSLCDGILFTGGQDVEPKVYGAKRLDVCGECCAQRDAMEVLLLDEALRQDKPLLGICRGLQLFNACLGGTLYQDLPTQHVSDIRHSQRPPYDVPVHSVRLFENTPLHALLKKREIRVNSYHHQAICNLSNQLEAMAAAPDGLIEAIYHPGKRFVWAVQWHPEFSYLKDSDNLAILRAFVCAAKE